MKKISTIERKECGKKNKKNIDSIIFVSMYFVCEKNIQQ